MQQTELRKWKQWGKTTLFIDYGNLIDSYQDLGWRIDFQKLKRLFEKYTPWPWCYFFDAVEKKRPQPLKFHQQLEEWGYFVEVNEGRCIRNRKTNSSCNTGGGYVNLTVEAIRSSSFYDTLLLFSDDENLVKLVEYLREDRGKRVVIFSARHHIAHRLAAAANELIPLDKLKRRIQLQEPAS
jgi:uncharacterized LabA/DUF88 family protein